MLAGAVLLAAVELRGAASNAFALTVRDVAAEVPVAVVVGAGVGVKVTGTWVVLVGGAVVLAGTVALAGAVVLAAVELRGAASNAFDLTVLATVATGVTCHVVSAEACSSAHAVV